MKRKLITLVGTTGLALLLASCTGNQVKNNTPLRAPATFNLTVAHLNDTHGRVTEGKYAGMGLPRVYTVIKHLREKK